MTAPLVIEFDVACSVSHAFDTWTGAIDRWWPHDHSVSADPDLQVVFELRAGGRIYERTAAGVEHDWGDVLVVEPPDRVVFRWYLTSTPDDATEVEITFHAKDDGTLVRLEHRGWERFADGAERRTANRRGWSDVTAEYRLACTEPPAVAGQSVGSAPT